MCSRTPLSTACVSCVVMLEVRGTLHYQLLQETRAGLLAASRSENMEPDSIPEYVRQFLINTFKDVRDEPPQGQYCVFSIKPSSGQLRHFLKVRQDVSIHPGGLLDYLRTHDFAGKLENSSVEIY